MAVTSSSHSWQHTMFVAGSLVLVVAALYFAKAVLVPIVLAILLTLVLGPIVNALQRLHLGRIPSVIGAVLLTFCLIGGIGFAVVVQLEKLATDLPQHKQEIEQKMERIRETGRGSWFVTVYDSFGDLYRTIRGDERAASRGDAPIPVVIESSSFPLLQSVAAPAIEVLLTGGMTIILLIFMLIQREDLRNRIIRLWGATSVTTMTKAFDDAIRRISRFLLVQLAINAGYGAAVAIGLSVIGVPYAIVWGFLAGTLRYIPYVGTWIGALLPIALSIAVLPGGTKPLLVLCLFFFLEMITYNIIEPWLFGQSVGVSATALLVAAAFWAWLWGPIGLVIATPLTACLAVLGRYVPHLEFFSVLLGDEPVLEPHVVYYQRLLARDQDEASDLVEDFVQSDSTQAIYDRVLVPALILAKENRKRGEFTTHDHQFLLETTREIADDVVLPGQRVREEAGADEPQPLAEHPVLVFGCPARDETDELALSMFRQLLDPNKCRFEVISHQKLTAEVVARVEEEEPKVICIACLPPTGLAHTRYLCKRLRAQFPDLKILVGCWGLEHGFERTRERLLSSGADQVTSTLLQTRDQLMPLIQLHSHIQATTKATAINVNQEMAPAG